MTPASPPVRPSRAAVVLSALVALLAGVATAVGLVWRGGEAPATFTSLRGETVELFGQGLYRYDSLFKAGANFGADAVTLFAAVPLLVAATIFYRRGSVRGALVLVGLLTWFLYLYASMALGSAYNELFLVYVALFGASLFAFALAYASLDLGRLAARLAPRLPRRPIAAFLLGSGALTAFVWGEPLLRSLATGEPPELLGASTTMVTDALDLAVITPLCFVAGGLLLRRDPRGYLVAFPLLALLAVLGPTIVAQTVAQIAVGYSFTTAQIAVPIAGFLVFASGAAVVVALVLRAVGAGAGERPSRGDEGAVRRDGPAPGVARSETEGVR